jgi:hypothetical protein
LSFVAEGLMTDWTDHIYFNIIMMPIASSQYVLTSSWSTSDHLFPPVGTIQSALTKRCSRGRHKRPTTSRPARSEAHRQANISYVSLSARGYSSAASGEALGTTGSFSLPDVSAGSDGDRRAAANCSTLSLRSCNLFPEG